MRRFVGLGVLATAYAILGCGPTERAAPDPVTLKSTNYCHASTTPGIFDYYRYLYTDGSVMIECEFSGNVYTVNSTRLYKSSQAGATTGACDFVMDLNGAATAGYWTFAYDGTSATTTYHDAGDGLDGTKFTLPCTTE